MKSTKPFEIYWLLSCKTLRWRHQYFSSSFDLQDSGSNTLTVRGIDTGGVPGLVYIQVGMDGPSTLISATPAAAYLDQVFNLADYPPGDSVVIGKYFLNPEYKHTTNEAFLHGNYRKSYYCVN